MSFGGGGDQKMEVTDYFMSIHFGICHGPLDALLAIYIDEKEAWSGRQVGVGEITINKPELHGGRKKEGGAVGIVQYLSGWADQLLPANLATKLGRTPTTCPGFRDIASIWFTGKSQSGSRPRNAEGFYWRSNSPYVPGVWAKVERFPNTGSYPFGVHYKVGDDANPAAMIYEILINGDWGMGANGMEFVNGGTFLELRRPLPPRASVFR